MRDSPDGDHVGALGSRETDAKRVAALEESGFTAEQIGRIHSPVGLDLGGAGGLPRRSPCR